MASININLLPVELDKTKKEKGKKRLFLQANIAILLVVVLISAAVLTIRVSQNVLLNNVNEELNQAKRNLESDQNRQKEGLVTVLRDRVDLISSASKKNFPASYILDLVNNLKPDGMSLISVATSKTGVLTLSVETTSNQVLDTFLNNLNNPGKNENKIKSAILEGLNRGATGVMKVELTINLAPA